MADKPLHPETLALHAGQTPDSEHLNRAVPIYQSAAYTFRDSDHAAALFDANAPGYFYTRIANPTVTVFEDRMLALEGGAAAMATASGASAIALTLLNLCRSRDHIVSASQIYGGTFTLFNNTFRRFGINTSFVDITALDDVRGAIDERSRALYCETIGNPTLAVPDFAGLAQIARDAHLPLIIDSTFTPPPLFRPLEHGANLVVHSATKYIGGHGTSIGGIVVDGGKFDWLSGRFKEFEMPSPAFHNKEYVKEYGPRAFITKARYELMYDIGAALSPFNAFLFIQGLETLPLRMQRHSDNALALARYLSQHRKVAWVNYPGLENHPQHRLAAQYFPSGAGGMLTFGVKGGLKAGRTLVESVKLASFVANLGDAKTLVIQPATTTHQQLSQEERELAGIKDELVRVSVGLEHIDDLKADFDQALSRV